MLNIVLFGPPGAGKGTQSEKLLDKYQLVHISTGDLFRHHLSNKTKLGSLAQSYMDKGELVPDEITISMLEDKVNQHLNAKGFIFDGFPRTRTQAQALDSFLETKNTSVTMMLSLLVPEEELVKRLLLRGKESGRADDRDEMVIRNRIDVYNLQTKVLAEHFQSQGKYSSVDGLGTIDEIFNRLCEVIDEVNVSG